MHEKSAKCSRLSAMCSLVLCTLQCAHIIGYMQKMYHVEFGNLPNICIILLFCCSNKLLCVAPHYEN